MNRIEELVYNLVRTNPALKQTIRNCYQGIFDLLPRKRNFAVNPLAGKEGYFFGFHDVTPFSSDETKLLAATSGFDFRMPEPAEGLTVGFFDFNDGKIGDFHQIGKSFAWNYHKGCRLQWLDSKHIIFNTACDGRLCSTIVEMDTFNTRIVPYPIDAVCGNMATSFSYERLERCMPGYGYPYKDDGHISESAPNDTGLYLLDLTTGERRLILSLYDIAMKVSGCIEDEYLHFVTHTEFSKDGRFISFLYRRIPKEGDYMKRRSVICVYDIDKGELNILPSQESGSHYVWNNKDQIVASCIINGTSCHVLFDMNDIKSLRPIAEKEINSDGHQSFVSDNVFVTDTYPDKRRMAKLYRVNLTDNKSELIASVYSPKKFQTKDFKCHIACDLHPRVSPSGRYVCFDSPMSGKRGIYVMPLTSC